MKYIFSIILIVCSLSSFAQNKEFKITGSVQTDGDKEPLESATVYLERVKDSSLVSYTISDKDGKFSLEDKTIDESLKLFISYVGYKTYSVTIKIDKEEISLEPIDLLVDDNALDEVLIKSRAPITIKTDTLEFNVKSFKTKKDANVEDLLKQLPGVEVDDEGNITVNGKDVNKILVNGKPFFGDDPTITTRNLTKELIEKVQITDTKTKAEAFTGEQGDNENKTINLTIKEENNKGVFGRVAAGAGTDDRYEFAGMLNLFDNDQRISVLAGGNNTNSAGFSFGEISKMFGGGRNRSFSSNGGFSVDGRSFGGGQGITTSKNIGANYADKIGKKVDISADYFYSGSNSENNTITERENILPDSRFFSDSNSSTYNESDNHSANLEFEIAVDSTLRIDIEPSFRKSMSRNTYSSIEETRDVSDVLTNDSDVSSFVETAGTNFSNEIDITKKFGNKGAFLRLSVDNEIDNTTTDDSVNSEANVYGDTPESIIRDQFTDGEQKLNSFNASATYRLPLKAKEVFLDFKFDYRSDKQENRRSTYDFDDGTQDYSIFNTQLSTEFENTNKRSTPSLRLAFRNDIWSFSLESGYVFRTLENNDMLRPLLSLNRNFEALELRSNFNYRFSPKSSIYSGYRLTNQTPNVRQLSPFQDVSNPLNIVTGNPDLEPSNNHNIYAGFNAFDFQKGTGFYAHIGGNLTSNAVVSKSVVDENFVRNTTYTNVDGNHSAYASATFSKTVKVDSLRTVKYRVGLSSNFNKSINFNNGVEYASNNTSYSPNAEITFTWKDVFELRPNYSISFNTTKFDINNFEDQNFVNHTLGINTATFLPKKFEWRNDISFNYNSNIAPGFQKSAWFWNSTLAYSMLKDQATLTLKAYDLLNQNTNARRTATQNYIQDSQSTVLEQYFMVSFSWKFNSLGSKGEIDSRGGRFYRH
ncbi:MAG: TonB-dependent receptor [Bacteroidetes bacterium]|nr:MAG: TonB-dependent receptor [Bacteroidota bacterium]